MSAGGSVLIIEDDIAIGELVRDYLEIEGFTVVIERDGSVGLARALDEVPSCVVLDIMLPGMSGFQVCRELRAQSDVPILVLSARKEDADKIRGLGLGADDWVGKPFSPAELVARVKAHIARYQRLTGAEERRERGPLAVGPLEIDYEAHEVRKRGVDLALTAREFELLDLFARHPGRLFSRDELFDRVWGDQHADRSTVTVHMRRLREKIEDDPSNPRLVVTVWGLGYKLTV